MELKKERGQYQKTVCRYFVPVLRNPWQKLNRLKTDLMGPGKRPWFRGVQGLVQRLFNVPNGPRICSPRWSSSNDESSYKRLTWKNWKYKEIELKNRSLFLERYYFRFSSIKKTYRYSSTTAITDGGHSEIKVVGMYSRTTNPLVVGNTKSLFFLVKSPQDNLL